MDAQVRGQLERAFGHALRAVGDYGRARLAYRRARRTFHRAGLKHEQAICALGLIDACMYLGRTQEALRVAAEARRVFVRRDDKVRIAKLETNVGNLHHRIDALEKALVHYDRAAHLFGSDASAAERARLDHNRANILTHLGRRREAEQLYLRARAALGASGERVLAAQVNYGLACLRFLGGEYAAAIAQLEEVRLELKRLGAMPLLALADLDLAEVLLAMRLHVEGLSLARSARRWFHAHSVPIERGKCDLLSGMALAYLARVEEATRALNAADRTFRASGYGLGRAAVALARAKLCQLENRPTKAVHQAVRAHRSFRRAGFAGRALAAGAVAAEALLEAKNWPQASRLSRKFLSGPGVPGDAYSRARLARVAGATAAAQGRTTVALRFYRDALDAAARAQSGVFVDEWRVGFREGEPAVTDELLGTLLARRPQPSPNEVWRWVARSREIAGSSTAATNPEEVAPAVRDAVARLRADLEGCYARLWRLNNGTAFRGAPANLRVLERRALRLESRLRRLATRSTSRFKSASRTFLRTTPSRAGETRLVYFSASGKLAAFRSDSNGIAMITDLGALEEISARLRLFHYQMQARGSGLAPLRPHYSKMDERARTHLDALGRALLDPMLTPTTIGVAPRIRVSPYGPLFRVPFHALTWHGAALIESAEVSIESAFNGTTRPRGTRRIGALVLGYSGSTEGGIEEEAQSVAKLLSRSGVSVDLRIGDAATSDGLLSAAGCAAIIHVAAHAVYRAEHPEFSALRLADRWFTVSDLARLPLNGACVILSACETGPKAVVGGDEVLGLVRGLIRAGAAAVIASHWRVDDRATSAFMQDLYAAWHATGKLGAGLREVQCAEAKQGRDLYLWAPFCLIGEPNVPWPAAGRQMPQECDTIESSRTLAKGA